MDLCGFPLQSLSLRSLTLFVIFSEIELSAGNRSRDFVVITVGYLVQTLHGSQALLLAI